MAGIIRKRRRKTAPSPFKLPKGAKEIHHFAWRTLLGDTTTDIRRLDSVNRFSSIPVTYLESTAAHSYWVSLFALMIWQKMEEHGWKGGLPDLGEVLRYAISHDAGEGVTGDVIRPMKYATPEMKRAVDSAERMLSEKLFPANVKKAVIFSPSEATKAIVKAADWMSLWHFMRREAARHNFEIIPYYYRMVRDLAAARDSAIPELVNLYDVICSEADVIGHQCFREMAMDSRWNREM